MKTETPDILSSIASGDVALKDTTSTKEAESIRVIDVLPRKIQTIAFLNGDYCAAKFYGPNRQALSRLFVSAPDLLAALDCLTETALENGATVNDLAIINALAAIAKAKGTP
jgi:hypothetical protein